MSAVDASAIDASAMAAARRNFDLSHVTFDERTSFVENVLRWILAQIGDGKLLDGLPITLVRHDYIKPMAGAKGPEVKLNHGKFSQGSVHLCNDKLTRANVLPSSDELTNVQSHEDLLAEKQYDGETSVTYNPVTGLALVRIRCSGATQAVPIPLAKQASAAWTTDAAAALEDALSSFHEDLTKSAGLGALMFDAETLRPNARVVYRDAFYLYLRYGMGLHKSALKVVAHKREVRVTGASTGFAARLRAIGTSSSNPVAAGRRVQRELEVAVAQTGQGLAPSVLTCVSCPTPHPPQQECAVAPNSLRHRHVA